MARSHRAYQVIRFLFAAVVSVAASSATAENCDVFHHVEQLDEYVFVSDFTDGTCSYSIDPEPRTYEIYEVRDGKAYAYQIGGTKTLLLEPARLIETSF